MPSYYRLGTEFTVNGLAAGDQGGTAVAAFADGGYVIAWSTGDTTQDGIKSALKAQLFDAGGNRVGDEFRVNSAADGYQSSATAATLNNGNFVIAWVTNITSDGSGEGIKAQLYDRSGAPIGGEFMVNLPTHSFPFEPNVAPLADGGFVISWDEASDMKAQMFDADGDRVGGVLRLNTDTSGIQGFGGIVGLAGGGFVATWRTSDPVADGSEWAVKAQIFDASGHRVGGEFLVNTKTVNYQNSPSIAALAGGGFVIVWEDTDPGWGNERIKAQIYDASGNRFGGELQVNTEGADTLGTAVVSGLPDGGFMVAWHNLFLAQPENELDIKAQQFSASGAKVGGEFLVNSLTEGAQWVPHIATLADGRVIIVWPSPNGDGDGKGVRAQIFAPNSGPDILSDGGGAAASLSVAENQTAVTTVAATDVGGPDPVRYAIAGGADAGSFVIDAETGALSFADAPDFESPADAGADNVYEVVVAASDGELAGAQTLSVTVTNVGEGNTIVGTAARNTIAVTKTVPGQPFATQFDDTIHGLAGADTLLGAGGADVIDGGAGSDAIVGGAGSDRLTGGRGADRFILLGASDSRTGAADVIADFGRGDRIDLAKLDANGTARGNQAFAFIGTADFSGVAGQLRFEQVGGDTFVSGDVNGDRLADFQIQLEGLIALRSADFIL